MTAVTVSEVVQPLEEFADIFEQHYELTYRTAYAITRSPEDAEDVVQSIFVQLLRREVPPDLSKNTKGYLYRAAVNLSLRTIRTKKRHVLTNEPDQFESPVAAQDDANQERDEMDQRLWAAISKLSEDASQILILRYVHNYKLADIARLLKTSRSAVAVSLFRSR